jgi:hypothetical protein
MAVSLLILEQIVGKLIDKPAKTNSGNPRMGIRNRKIYRGKWEVLSIIK